MPLPSNNYDPNYVPKWKKQHMDPKQLKSGVPEGVHPGDVYNWRAFKRHITKSSARGIVPEVFEVDSGKRFELRGFDDWGMTQVETYPFKHRKTAELALTEIEKLLEAP